MKLKSVFFLGFLLFISVSHAQYVSIPDTIFGAWLNGNGFATCMTGNSGSGWSLDTTCTAVLADTSMKLPDSVGIHSVEGVRYFKRLTYFNCSENALDSLASLPPLLEKLFCERNNLTSLPSLPNSLIQIFCSSNIITSLPTLPVNLVSFFCDGNRLDTLPALPANLDYFNCSHNRLTSLPNLPASLSVFNCSENPDLYCLPHLNRIVQFHFDSTGISCLPNVPTGNSDMSPASIPICNASCAFISGILDVNINAEALKIYPNPVTDILYFDFSTEYTSITISDMTGRMMPLLVSDSSIDVSALNIGIYFIHIQYSNRDAVEKFVKE